MPGCNNPSGPCDEHKWMKAAIEEMQGSFREIIKDLNDTTQNAQVCINGLKEAMRRMEKSSKDIVGLQEKVVGVEKDIIKMRTADEVSDDVINKIRRDVALVITGSMLLIELGSKILAHFNF